MNDDLEILKG